MSRPGDIDEADPHYSKEERLHESHTISADELRALYEERELLKKKLHQLEKNKEPLVDPRDRAAVEAISHRGFVMVDTSHLLELIDGAFTAWNKSFREAASTEANMLLLSANKRLTIENDSLKEHNARLEKACDIFEKNSANACDLATKNIAMRSLLQSMLMQDPRGMLALNVYWQSRIEEVLK